MKWILNIVGVLLFLMGTLWFLQGTGIVPVGGMAYHIQYAYAGLFVDVIGAGALVLANRHRPKLPPAA